MWLFLKAILGFFLIYTPVGAWNAFILNKMWLWFLVPLGLPLIGFWHAFGLVIFINFIRIRVTKEDLDELEENSGMGVVKIAFSLILSTIALILGYIIHLFM